MRGIGLAVCTVAIATLGWSAQTLAQSACPASGSELVFFGAGGRPQGPPQANPQPDAGLAPQGIYVACLDTKTGQLSSLGIQAKVSKASWVLVDPKKSVIYSTGVEGGSMSTPGSIYSFKINPATGALTPLATSPSGGTDPTHLAWDPHSDTLFVANHGEGIVGVIKTGADGAARLLSDKAQQQGSGPSPRQKNAEAHGLAVDPTGHFVLCSDFGADKIYVYRFDASTGKLSPSSPAFLAMPAGTGPRHIAFTPNGKYVVMNTELNGQLQLFRWNEKAGTLEKVQDVDPFAPDFKDVRSAGELEVSHDGKFVYMSLRGKENSVIVYALNEGDGKLTEVQRVSSGGDTPWSFGLDPSGKWLLVTNSVSGTVTVFSVDKSTGKLTPAGVPLKMPAVMTVAFLAH